jgi:hypothetical protein
MPRAEINGFIDFGTPERRNENKRQFMDFIALLEGMYHVRLEPKKNTRTNRQNSFWWAVCQRFAKYLSGDTGNVIADDVHQAMKDEYLKCDLINHRTGAIVGSYTRSTTTLSVEEMSEFIDRVQGDIFATYRIPPMVPDERDQPQRNRKVPA